MSMFLVLLIRLCYFRSEQDWTTLLDMCGSHGDHFNCQIVFNISHCLTLGFSLLIIRYLHPLRLLLHLR